MTTNTMIANKWKEIFENEKKELIQKFNESLYKKNVIHSELQKIVLHRNEDSPYIACNLPIATSVDDVRLKDIKFDDSFIFKVSEPNLIQASLIFNFHGEEVVMGVHIGTIDLCETLGYGDGMSNYIFPLHVDEEPSYIYTDYGTVGEQAYIRNNEHYFLEETQFSNNGESFNEDEHDISIALFNVLEIHNAAKFHVDFDLISAYFCSIVEEKAKDLNLTGIEDIKISDLNTQKVDVKFKGAHLYFEMNIRDFLK